MDKIPLKKKLSVGAGVAALMFVAYLLSTKLETTKVSSKAQNTELSIAAKILDSTSKLPPAESAAGDGIPNWQKVIRGIDPSTKAEQIQNVSVSSSDLKRLQDDNNMTVALAKNNATLSGYLTSLSVNDKANIDQNGLSEDALKATAASFSFKTYTSSDLKNKVAPTQATRKAFGNNLAKITSDTIVKYIKTNDIVSFQDIVDNKGSSQNALDLKKKLDGMTAFRNSLLSMPVPSDAISYHLTYVNAVEQYVELLQAFIGEKDDPLKAGAFLRGYKPIVQGMFTTFEKYSDYFTANNLVFTSKDYGYVFTVGIIKK